MRPTPAESASLPARVWLKIDTESSEYGCWLWTGTLDRAGYAPSWNGRKRGRYAHQIAYALAHGERPAGTLLANRCGMRACVNPQHWDVSSKEDIGRKNRGRTRKR